MSSLTLGEGRRAVAACAACALWLGLADAPARAADDGAAPMWVGIGSIFGLTGNKDQEPIDYRDRAKLVLPPSVSLPPPAAAAVDGSVAWPVDPDVAKRKKAKAEKDNYVFVPLHMRDPHVVSYGAPVTVGATAGQAPGQRACVNAPGQACATRPSPSVNWNPLTWVGLEKKAPTVLGPEPDRDWLTDPPKGYREPAEGPGVQMEN
jgi:hypothetical protein